MAIAASVRPTVAGTGNFRRADGEGATASLEDLGVKSFGLTKLSLDWLIAIQGQ